MSGIGFRGFRRTSEIDEDQNAKRIILCNIDVD